MNSWEILVAKLKCWELAPGSLVMLICDSRKQDVRSTFPVTLSQVLRVICHIQAATSFNTFFTLICSSASSPVSVLQGYITSKSDKFHSK